MELTVSIEEINYGDVAVKVLPLLSNTGSHRSNAAAKMLAAIAQLPDQLICSVFDAIPTRQKHEIFAEFAAENRGRIIAAINHFSESRRLGVAASDFSMNQVPEFRITISAIDYPCIAERFLPIIRQKLLNTVGGVLVLRAVIEHASAAQICGLLDRFVGDKDAFLASLVNQNQQRVISLIEDAAQKQNIHLKIRSVSLQT